MGWSDFWLSFLVTSLLCLGNCKGFILDKTNEVKQINTTSDEFLDLQVRVIESYKKTKPDKKWSCSYKDHINALSYVPRATSSQQIHFSEMVKQSLNGTGMKLIRGAKSVAELKREDIIVILIWDGMMINSLEYFNVLYGGKKYFHVGIGVPYPDSYYGNQNEEFRFYDLKSCVPFAEWIINAMDHRVKEVLIMPKESNIEIRNAVKGIAALLPENMNTDGAFNFFPNTTQLDLFKKNKKPSKSNGSSTED